MAAARDSQPSRTGYLFARAPGNSGLLFVSIPPLRFAAKTPVHSPYVDREDSGCYKCRTGVRYSTSQLGHPSLGLAYAALGDEFVIGFELLLTWRQIRV